MKYLRINPFYLLATFYFLINFCYAVSGYINSSMELEFQNNAIDSINFIYAFMFQVVSLLLIIFSYYLVSNATKKDNLLYFSNSVGFFLIFGQIFFLLINFYFGANIAGDNSEFKGNPLINIIFILLPFDILFFILGLCLKSSKLFFLNSILYLISNLIRGWMGAPLLLVFAILCRKEYIKLNFKNSFFILIFVTFLMLISPYLMELKWIVRGKIDDASIIENVENYGYLNYLSESVDYIFNRFQHVGHVAMIIQNQDFLNVKYNLGYIVPYWAEGLPQSIFMKILHIDSFMTLPRFVTIELFSAPLASSWTVNVGLAGWMVVLKTKFLLLIFFIFLIVFLPFYFVSKFGNKRLLLMLACFSLFYLFHGWFYAYVTFLMYLILIILINKAKI